MPKHKVIALIYFIGSCHLREHPVPTHTDDPIVVVERGRLDHVEGVVGALRHDHLAPDARNLEDARYLGLPDLLGRAVASEGVDEDQQVLGSGVLGIDHSQQGCVPPVDDVTV